VALCIFGYKDWCIFNSSNPFLPNFQYLKMKRVLDFIMNNKYFIIVFSVVVFGFKLVFDKYELPGQYLPVLATLEAVFLIVLITCLVHVLSFFVFALVSGKKPEPWWDNLENNRKSSKENIFSKAFSQGLIVSIPLAVYGVLIYVAVYASWQNILTIMFGFAITRLINYFQNRKKSDLQQRA
jgi:hypothetical protein